MSFFTLLPALEVRPEQSHETAGGPLPFSLILLTPLLSFVSKLSLIFAQEQTSSTRVMIKYRLNGLKNKTRGWSALHKEIRQDFAKEKTLWSFLEGQAAIFQVGEVCGGGYFSKKNSVYKGTEPWMSRLLGKPQQFRMGGKQEGCRRIVSRVTKVHHRQPASYDPSWGIWLPSCSPMVINGIGSWLFKTWWNYELSSQEIEDRW